MYYQNMSSANQDISNPTPLPTVPMSSPNVSSPNPASSSASNDKAKDKVKLEWNDQTEEMVAAWTDIAACYNWLHS